MSTTLLRGGRLVQDGCITRCDILLRGKAVDAVLPPDSGAAADFVYDLAGLYVSAGFIDIHVHGGGGHDFMDGTPEAYHGASALHLRHGTTAMVPTTLAASEEELLRSFSVFERCRDGFADGCCFSERMRKLFRKNEKNVLRFCNKKAKEKRRLQRVKKPM